MAGYVANAVKGKVQWYYEQARDGAPDLGALLLITAGLQGNAVLEDYATVAAIKATSNTEANFANYTRKTLPIPTVTVDHSLNRVVLGLAGTPPVTVQWPNAGVPGTTLGAGANNLLGKVVWYYDPTPGSSNDAQLIHLGGADISFTTDGTTLVLTLGANGLATVEDP